MRSEMIMCSFPQLLASLIQENQNLNIQELEVFYFIPEELVSLLDDFLNCFDNLQLIRLRILHKKPMLDILKILGNKGIYKIDLEYHGPTIGVIQEIKSFINEHFDKKITVH